MINQVVITGMCKNPLLSKFTLPDGKYYLTFSCIHANLRKDGTYKKDDIRCRFYSRKVEFLQTIMDWMRVGFYATISGALRGSLLKSQGWRRVVYIEVHTIDIIRWNKQKGEPPDEVDRGWSISYSDGDSRIAEGSGAADK